MAEKRRVSPPVKKMVLCERKVIILTFFISFTVFILHYYYFNFLREAFLDKQMHIAPDIAPDRTEDNQRSILLLSYSRLNMTIVKV